MYAGHVIGALSFAALLIVAPSATPASATGTQPPITESEVLAQLAEVRIDARDLKTLHYVENAHGQIGEWTARLYGRLGLKLGPREADPILDGRADLQVRKIAYTYATFTRNPALSHALLLLADAEQARVAAVRRMIKTGPDAELWATVNEPVNQLMNQLRDWSKLR